MRVRFPPPPPLFIMKKYIPTITVFILFLMGGFAAFSQSSSHPDFSGDWSLNLAESKVSKGTSPDVLQRSADLILHIVHKEPEFTASTIRPDTRDVVTSSTYYTDDRETKTDDGLSIAKTKWDGKKLVTQIKPSTKEPDRIGTRGANNSVTVGAGTIKRELRFEWELLPDGRLSQKIRITSRSEFQILDRHKITEDKTEIVKVYDPIKTIH